MIYYTMNTECRRYYLKPMHSKIKKVENFIIRLKRYIYIYKV